MSKNIRSSRMQRFIEQFQQSGGTQTQEKSTETNVMYNQQNFIEDAVWPGGNNRALCAEVSVSGFPGWLIWI